MKITFRLIISLVLVVATVAAASAYFQVRQEREKQREELERRSRLLASSLQETIELLIEKSAISSVQRLVEKFGNRERLAGVAVYDAIATPVAMTQSLASALSTAPEAVTEALKEGVDTGRFDTIGDREMHLYTLPLRVQDQVSGALVLFHDASYIQTELWRIWKRTFDRVLVQTLLISVVTLLIVRWSFVGPIAQMAEWMKHLRSGESIRPFVLGKKDLFAPLAREASALARHLSVAKTAAKEEVRLRQAAESLWTPERLREHARAKLGGKPLFVVSNREPYMHLRRGRKIEVIVPAGGLVTALEPVLRACEGTWIAHGSGDADWEMVDKKGRIKVPPDDPMYVLKRVALTKLEETGYYYGFSNEGLWPLCHIAHTRPIFRTEDWEDYCKANRKFAQAALEELEGLEEPCVLVQDYHFALLPRLLKEKRPDARVALFWHIPWPNPEAFGICPWQREILHGMLGADLIGFHTQFHCNNFLDTVDRSLESRIDWERFSAQKGAHTTLVKPFPISVGFPAAFQDVLGGEASGQDATAMLNDLGLKARYMGVGVERMDYTKGILERFRAIERFLEKYPQYQREFVFVQLGAPSRTHIKRYQDFLAEVEAEVERINWRFQSGEWKPIVFLKKHHTHQEILPFYRTADLCMVTSLHDGMNLVAKEFVAAREDEHGVLILSRFTGASRELRDALIVNPYDIEELADAIYRALNVTKEEQAIRMRRMREVVREHNVYRWAGDLITELVQIRVEESQVSMA